MMICPSCSKEVLKLIAAPNKLECDFCHQAPAPSHYIPDAHIYGDNKHAPRMSRLKQWHIKTRHIGKDGRVVSHPRYETKEW